MHKPFCGSVSAEISVSENSVSVFAPSILLRYSGSVQNSLLLPVAEGKEEGEQSFIKEIISSSILDHKASLARATIFVQCLIVGNISGLNKPSNEQF